MFRKIVEYWMLPGILLVLVTCDTGTGPNHDDVECCEFPPGNRSFSWQVDTVAWFPSTLGGVWAFSDDDAFVMGRMFSNENPQTLNLALHWNEETWSEDNYTENFSDINHYSNDVTGDDFYMVSVGYWAVGDEKAGLAEFDNRTKKWNSQQFQREGALREVWTNKEGFFMAVGDNGMVYTKDGYEAEWIYSNGPTDFHFTKINGVSKNEIYIRAYLSVPGEPVYNQLWKYTGNEWYKLYDNQDPSDIYLHLEGGMNPSHSGVADVAAWRSADTDSLQLYIISNESYLATAYGQSLNFETENLANLGLPLRQNQRTGLGIDLFTPNDIWIYGTRYNFYHWNGINFQKMEIPGLPHDDMQFGTQRKMRKTDSGKIFFPTEVSSQVYVVVQGTPLD